MTLRRVQAAAAAASLALSAAAGAHAECTLPAYAIPVAMFGREPRVDAKLDGIYAGMVLDSGASLSTIDPAIAEDRKLSGSQAAGAQPGPAAGSVTVVGVGGAVRAKLVTAHKFEMGGAEFADVPFVATRYSGSAAGLIGQNFLRRFDVEYDLANAVIRLTSPHGCAGFALAYWTRPDEAYSTLPLQVAPGVAGAVVWITVNGVKLRAELDTGSSASMLTLSAAAKVGVRPGDPGVEPSGRTVGIGPRVVRTWAASFAKVKIGDEEFKNAWLPIGDTALGDIDMLIGMDFFLTHRVYVSNLQRELYFTYNGGPVFDLPLR